MKYFFSGASGIRANLLPLVAAVLEYRLLSMHEAFKGNTKVWTAVSHHKDCAMKECMLDSGAFTAFTKGKKVKLDDLIRIYDDTIGKLRKGIQVWLINLDVIPGTPGAVATPTEIDQALDESDKNFKILRKRYGDIVLPVFHQTEPGSRLYECAKMSKYVAFSFRQDFAEKHRVAHAEESLAIANKLGITVHGLATTGYEMLRRTNFDSVDSASWLYACAMGKVLTISEHGDLSVIPISSQSPNQKDYRGHFISLPPDEQQYLLKRFALNGCTHEQLSTNLSYRILYTAKEMTEWLKSLQRPKIQHAGSLFGL